MMISRTENIVYCFQVITIENPIHIISYAALFLRRPVLTPPCSYTALFLHRPVLSVGPGDGRNGAVRRIGVLGPESRAAREQPPLRGNPHLLPGALKV